MPLAESKEVRCSTIELLPHMGEEYLSRVFKELLLPVNLKKQQISTWMLMKHNGMGGQYRIMLAILQT